MRNAPARRACALVVFALFSAALIPAALAQSGWSKFKQRVLEQACKGGDQNSGQQSQQGQSRQPAQQTGAAPQQYGQPAAASPQNNSGPFKPPAGTRVNEVVLAPLQSNAKFFISPHGVHVATLIDGKPVAETELAIEPNSREAWWDMAPDGSLSFVGQDQNNLKRITITPSSGSNLATLLGGSAAGIRGN